MAKKSGLGRGLGALMLEAEQEHHDKHHETAPLEVALDSIHPNPNQPRTNFDEATMEELVSSIKQHGILQPLLVRPVGDGYEIIAGERRYQAAKRAKLTKLPVFVRKADESEAFKLALIENLQRSDLDPIEEAQGYATLLERDKLTQTQIAEVVSKSRSYVANALRLLDLPKEVQELLTTGQLTPGHARAILAVPDEENRIRLAKRVVEQSMTVRETEKLAPLFAETTTPPKKRQPSPDSYKRAARQLRDALATKVLVKQVRGKNKIEIEFSDEEDLGRLVTAILHWKE